MLVSNIQILPLTLIQRERTLPIPGKILVRRGQKVAARDVIAETDLEPKHILLNIASSLGVTNREADDLIQCKENDHLKEGDLIAGPVGLTRKVVRASADGKVMLVGGGQVLLQLEKEPYQLRAGLVGIVERLIPDFGAVVETAGALIQGVWGNGKADFGLMQFKLDMPDDELKTSQIDVSLRGTMVVGGYCNDPTVFQKAASVPVKGLILSSMPANQIKIAKKMDFPVILLEGFGRLALNKISYNLLKKNHNCEVSLNASPLNHNLGRRPEVIIPLPHEKEPALPAIVGEFSVGQQVRVVRKPHHAKIGTIQYIYYGLVKFPNGVRAPGAQVSFEDGDNVKVPLGNLEVVI